LLGEQIIGTQTNEEIIKPDRGFVKIRGAPNPGLLKNQKDFGRELSTQTNYFGPVTNKILNATRLQISRTSSRSWEATNMVWGEGDAARMIPGLL
jgi:hypothetical protein